ncbi:glycoside hydrolase family 6 protein [Cryptosporangium minutisporangium]|uniref:glycoside hydrolase family 6 protein n=1 Tax=Cryptosporangium minutisporangium TaxID=113569 RepID=UPI0031E96B48
MAPRHRRPQRVSTPMIVGLAVVVALVACGLTIALTSGGESDGNNTAKPKPSVSIDPDNPLSGKTFYVNPQNPAAQNYRQLKNAGNTADAEQLNKIASRPIAEWLASDDGQTTERVTALAAEADKAGQTAVMTVYFVPDRDCGQYSSGGAADAASYKTYIDEISTGLTGHDAVIVLEPDAIAHTLDGCITDEGQIKERLGLLTYALTTLKKNPEVRVYVDAGNASWIKDLDRMVAALKQVGVNQADGFALNVSNFETTDASVDYGNQLSDALEGEHFVIDTSRNGNGPYTETTDDQKWCNPPGRALGTPPTSDTGIPKVDAFLWVKQPGDSDGACRDGEPAAGQWWPEYALSLAKAST